MPVNTDSLLLLGILIAAIFFDLLIGEYPSVIHPVVWMGGYIKKMLLRAELLQRSSGRFAAGAGIVLSGVLVSGLIASVISYPLSFYNGNQALIIAAAVGCLFLVKSTFSISALIKAALSVYRALADTDLPSARELTSMHLVSRDTSGLNSREISAAVIESVSENLTDSVISPWLFMLIGGPAGAVCYRFVNTCDSMMGYRNGKYEWLGKFAARADDVLNFIPARLAGFLLVSAAVFRRDLSARNALKTMLREHRATESPNAGWTMAAAAGALGVRLEKKGCYTIAGGIDLPGEADIIRAAGLVRLSILLAFVLYSIALLLCSGIFL